MQIDVPLSGKLGFLVGGDEDGGQSKGAQAQAALRAAADVVDESDGALVGLLLVEVLVLNGVEVDKVAHVGAQVAADVLGVDVDFAEVLDHLVLVGLVGL